MASPLALRRPIPPTAHPGFRREERGVGLSRRQRLDVGGAEAALLEQGACVLPDLRGHARRDLLDAGDVERAVDNAQAESVDRLREEAVGFDLRVGDVIVDRAYDAGGEAGVVEARAPGLP